MFSRRTMTTGEFAEIPWLRYRASRYLNATCPPYATGEARRQREISRHPAMGAGPNPITTRHGLLRPLQGHGAGMSAPGPSRLSVASGFRGIADLRLFGSAWTA